MGHRFRAPKKDDEKNGSLPNTLSTMDSPTNISMKNIENTDIQKLVPYPNNLRDAKECVTKYKEQAI